jgi:cytochrome c551
MEKSFIAWRKKMINKFMLLASCFVIVLQTGCSDDYTPAADADGEAIFIAACVKCHALGDDKPGNMFFTLNQKNANKTYVAHKVHSGSISMPKFPNIQGRKMDLLSEFVLDHSMRE